MLRSKSELPGLDGYLPAGASARYDLRSKDGRTAVKFKVGHTGVRELHDGLAELALALDEQSGLRLGCLVMLDARVTWERVIAEWTALLGLLRCDLQNRLGLVWIDEGGNGRTMPESGRVEALAEAVQSAIRRNRPARAVDGQALARRFHTGLLRALSPTSAPHATISGGFFEVFKVLVATWLRGGGKSTLGDLQRLCGLSYPTVAGALADLQVRGELQRNRDRSVELSAFPRHTWGQIEALSDHFRRPIELYDPSGRTPEPEFLLARLRRIRPPGVAFGGILGASHWHPDLDFVGCPRLDLCLLARSAPGPEELLARLDPTLRPCAESAGRFDAAPQPLLVLHYLHRQEALFEPLVADGLPVADPAETLLDLHELNLDSQALELVKHLSARRGRA